MSAEFIAIWLGLQLDIVRHVATDRNFGNYDVRCDHSNFLVNIFVFAFIGDCEEDEQAGGGVLAFWLLFPCWPIVSHSVGMLKCFKINYHK